MELKPTFISDDNPNKDINVAFYNIPIVKRYMHFLSIFVPISLILVQCIFN
jgi:hypothetical protein